MTDIARLSPDMRAQLDTMNRDAESVIIAAFTNRSPSEAYTAGQRIGSMAALLCHGIPFEQGERGLNDLIEEWKKLARATAEREQLPADLADELFRQCIAGFCSTFAETLNAGGAA